MSQINEFLKELRERRHMTLRMASEKSGLSHSYISSLENGKHPQTKAPINPSPESLKKLSEAYNYPYEELMRIAGYIQDNKKESAPAPQENKLLKIVEKIKEETGIDVSDDPVIMEEIESYLTYLATKKK